MPRADRVSFQDYLEAKRAVDEASLNRSVQDAFFERLAGMSSVRLLDLGTGTGAALRRLIERNVVGGGSLLVGLDTDEASLSIARRRVREAPHPGAGADGPRVEFAGGSLLDGATRSRLLRIGPQGEGMNGPDAPFDIITANAFMDILPLQSSLAAIESLLSPRGLLYLTINYDGRTSLYPSSADREADSEILHAYDRSMDERTLDGMPVGGSRTGSRLYDLLSTGGYRVVAFGPSDWSVFESAPPAGEPRDDRHRFLAAMLDSIYREMLVQLEGGRLRLTTTRLERWYEERNDALESGRFGIITHQTDILAEKVSA